MPNINSQKFHHYVDVELSGQACYRHPANVEGHALTYGSTLRIGPGVYEMGAATFDGVTLEGLGSKQDVVLANLVLTAANTVIFKNLTLSGNSPAAASTSAAIFTTTSCNTTSKIRFEDVMFVNGDFGIDHQGLSALWLERCDGTGVDRLLRSNAVHAANVNFTVGNLSSNAWFTGANATLKAATTFMSSGGAANTGNTTKTARSAL
jgi:hypothetical protein